MSSLEDVQPIGRFGRFELITRLAFGGMAEIFLARETLPGSGGASSLRHLVVKRLLPQVAADQQFLGMFADEARLAQRLHHPSICEIFEFGDVEGAYYLAMEWVDGVSLKKLVRHTRGLGGIPIEMCGHILAETAGALHYAHTLHDDAGEALCIVHRDVSPQNIMVGFDGRVRLLDFGIAKARTHMNKTKSGVIKGKTAYMAPEQCLGQELDARTDVFAAGLCFYEGLTGRALYERPSEYETMRAIVNEQAPPSCREHRSDVPPAIDDIVRRAVAREPSRRFQSASSLRAAIETALAESGRPMNHDRVALYLEKSFYEDMRRGPVVDSVLSHPIAHDPRHLIKRASHLRSLSEEEIQALRQVRSADDPEVPSVGKLLDDQITTVKRQSARRSTAIVGALVVTVIALVGALFAVLLTR